jgi:hypothetical protein
MKRLKYYLVSAVAIILLTCLSTGIVDAKCIEAQTPNPADFSSPQDNLYFPMAIGSTYVYWAETEDELTLNEITITSDTVVILGITCIVIYDVEWVSPDDGITWYMTEDEAEDMGKVQRLNASVSIDYGDYKDCLKTKEWTPLDPGAIEHKFYAPGVGLVYIEELKEKTVRVELIDIL